jgi:hypothetical protein
VVSLSVVAAFTLAVFRIRNPQAPEAGFETARSAIADAVEAGAPQYATEAYRIVERTFEDGWLEMARQRGRLRILRDYRLADSLLTAAARQANGVASAARDSLAGLKATANTEFGLLQARLENSRNILDSLLTDHPAEDHWLMAHSSLTVGMRLIEMGAYEDARESFGGGMVSLDRLDALLADYLGDEGRRIALWRRWVGETLSESRRGGCYALIVDKSAHTLYMVRGGELFRVFPCELGRNPALQKRYAGDGATPEGKYRVTKVKRRGSRYYKALLLDYPNKYDRERYAENKAGGAIPYGAGPGAHIEIHGMGGKGMDWTDGCVALTNKDMDAIMQHVDVGTPITIVRKSDQWP